MKGKKISERLFKSIVKAKEEGEMTIEEIANTFNVSISAVIKVIKISKKGK